MGEKQLVYKPKFLGILGDVLLRGLFLGIAIVILNFLNSYREGIYEKHGVDFFGSFTLEIDFFDLGILALIYIATLVVLFLIVRFFYRFVAVWFRLGGETIIDLEQGKITATKMMFPFTRVSTESKCHDIIEVEIYQNIFDQAFNTGALTIEYLVLSDVDSQMKDIRLMHLKNPERKKQQLLQ